MREKRNSMGPKTAGATDSEKIRIGVSACLLGMRVRYDGGHKHDPYVTESLGRIFHYVPVCPEVEYGLPVPRETLRLVGDPASPRLITSRTGVDHTEAMEQWSQARAKALSREGLAGFIFRSRSPSSGLKGVTVYNDHGRPAGSGSGIFAAAFLRQNPLVPVIDDEKLRNPAARESFIDGVLIYTRWQAFLKKGGRPSDLPGLHADLSLLIRAHSPRHYAMLGRLLAESAANSRDELHASYAGLLMAAAGFPATRRKHERVLLHCLGCFRKRLTTDESAEMLDIIGAFRKGSLPLIAPLTMIDHYVRKYRVGRLARQCYLNPSPIESMLRNHL
jgi:uncharacterized protein YbbK (DUF523 family)/uncharacterized protein YbgA (DUF1722 family)